MNLEVGPNENVPETMWKMTFKPSALHALSGSIPKNDLPRVLRGLDALCTDPKPNGSERRKVKAPTPIYRAKVHGFRVLYVFDDTHVSVLDIRPREDDHATYGRLPDAEHQGAGPDADVADVLESTRPPPDLLAAPPSISQKLPQVTVERLEALDIPASHHAALMACQTEDELLDCESVPERFRLRLIDGLLQRPVEELLAQPELVVESPDDLIRYREGELMGFLLRLNAEQEKFVSWASSAKGPTLLKGGPGSGKSTVVLYRVRVFLDKLRAAGVKQPRILFTTYTRALTRVSEQLLTQLLGDDARFVEVTNADTVAVRLVRAAEGDVAIANSKQLREVVASAIDNVAFEGNTLQRAAQRKTLERMGRDYLSEEIFGVIEARGLETLDDYLEASRPGRGMPLGKTQRLAVWKVRDAVRAQLRKQGIRSWEEVRAAAATLAAHSSAKYDAVVVDEAQDLQPTTLRMLVELAKEPGRLFLTADANQSIYGAGFRWKDVHAGLRFTGRTGVLKANHRSTREIGEAAESYLAGGALDEEQPRAHFIHTGPLPVVREVAARDEIDLVARFIRAATRTFRLGSGSAAVLCPTRAEVNRIATGLQQAGLTAKATDAKNLDLTSNGVKVLTLKSAKGLEFPVVAIAGLGDEHYPALWARKTEEQQDELLLRERRTLFVAMTRAMRGLLVALPRERELSLFDGFEDGRWNRGEAE